MPADAHGGAPLQASSRSSHAVNSHHETVHPVVSYKIGYFKHVCTASVFKQVNNLRRKLETGADWASLEAVHELHKLLLECTTTHQKDVLTDPSSSCSQADTESPQSSPRSSDVEGARHYPLSDVAVQVDTCFDDLDEWNIELPIVDIDGVHEHRQPEGEERTASQKCLAEDPPSARLKKPVQRRLAPEPTESRMSCGFSPSRSFWMVTEESRERIRELEATVEALSAEHAAALEQVDAMQRTLAQVAAELRGEGAGDAESEQTESSTEEQPEQPVAELEEAQAAGLKEPVEQLAEGLKAQAPEVGGTRITHGRDAPRLRSVPAADPEPPARTPRTPQTPRTPRDTGGCSAWLSSPNPEAGKVVVVPAGAASNDVDLDETQSQYVEAPKRLYAF